MAEKILISVEVGTEGTINFNTGKLSTKEATAELLSTVIAIGLKQGYYTGEESTIKDLIIKLK